MNKTIVRRSTGGWIVFAIVGLTVMFSEFIHANRHINGIVFIGAFVFIAAVVQLLFTAPRAIIDDEGISAYVLGKRKFLWKEIRSVELKHKHRSGDVITLVLHDNTRHSFMLFGVNTSPEQVYAEITANIHEFGGGVASQPAAENEDAEDFN